MNTILIIEDEQHLAVGLQFNLEAEGYIVELAADGESGLALLRERPADFDAVVLDVMLPGVNGFDVAAELRRRGQFVPILMLTARSRPEDVLRGFEAGADDYLPKPFELAILIARLKGLLRRCDWMRQPMERRRDAAARSPRAATTEEVCEFAGKTIDFSALELRAGERVIRLTLMEADLLRYLIDHAGQPVARKAMLEEVWGLHEDTDTRAIDNFIVRLRKYIEDDPAAPKHLLTVRGVGYRFVTEPEEQS